MVGRLMGHDIADGVSRLTVEALDPEGGEMRERVASALLPSFLPHTSLASRSNVPSNR